MTKAAAAARVMRTFTSLLLLFIMIIGVYSDDTHMESINLNDISPPSQVRGKSEYRESGLDEASVTSQAGDGSGARLLREWMDATKSSYGSCWIDIIRSLKRSCASMDDEERSRVALKMANCHLRKSGVPEYPCAPEQSLEACTKDMYGTQAYATYTEFYNHAYQVCAHIDRERYQQEAKASVAFLHRSVDKANQFLTSLDSAARSMEQRLTTSVDVQQQLLSEQQSLDAALKAARNAQDIQFQEALKKTEQSQELQTTLFEHQQQFREETKEGFDSVFAATRNVRERLDRAIEMQRELQALQAKISTELQDISTMQASVRERVQLALRGQEQILSQQEEMAQAANQRFAATTTAISGLDAKAQETNIKLTESIEREKELLHHQLQARASLEDLRNSTRAAFEEAHTLLHSLTTDMIHFFSSAKDEVAKHLDKIYEVQRLLVGEFFDLKALFFYVAACILGFILTATRQTSRARFWIFASLSANLLVERSIRNTVPLTEVPLYLWYSRVGFVFFSLLSLLYSIFSHRDFNKLNHSLLSRLLSRQDETYDDLAMSVGALMDRAELIISELSHSNSSMNLSARLGDGSLDDSTGSGGSDEWVDMSTEDRHDDDDDDDDDSDFQEQGPRLLPYNLLRGARYSFRPRRLTRPNPLLSIESPSDFMRRVEQRLQQTYASSVSSVLDPQEDTGSE